MVGGGIARGQEDRNTMDDATQVTTCYEIFSRVEL